MSIETPTAHQSAVTTADSTDDAIEMFVATVTDALEQCDAPDETVGSVKAAGQQLAERVRADHEQRDEERDSVARQVAEVRGDLHDLTETVESDGSDNVQADVGDATPTGDGENTRTQNPETSLGQAICLPEHVAEENLTQNQQRARSVAKDVHQYATSVPAGYRLSASELRRVLSAQEDGATIHGQTLNRVRDFLLRLGGEHVELKESRGGTTSVIFDESFVKRVVAWANHDGGHGAVTRGGVSG